MIERGDILPKAIIEINCAPGDLEVAKEAFYDIGIHNIYIADIVALIPNEDGSFGFANHSRIQASCQKEEQAQIECALKEFNVPYEISKVESGDFDG